jgi:hypothetical protein
MALLQNLRNRFTDSMTHISMLPEPLILLVYKERGKMARVGTQGHITPDRKYT